MTDLTGTVKIRGKAFTVHVDNPADVIHREILAGRLYEQRQLDFHADLVFAKSTVLDVGANIGNHTLFYAAATRASRIYPFEPHPRTHGLLRSTVAANQLRKVDLSYVEYGVGAAEATFFVGHHADNNLGNHRLARTGEQQVTVKPLDGLEFEGAISLIKIDVESMEMDVLAGAEETIARHRPAVAIEVDNVNMAAFWAWADQHRYRVINVFRQYAANVNYICAPMDMAPVLARR